jgi:hypothetical protein
MFHPTNAISYAVPGRKSGDQYGPKAHRLLPEQSPTRSSTCHCPENVPTAGSG